MECIPIHSASIEKSLAEGTTIVCDRYAFSGVAFSASKGLSFEWCRSPDIGVPAPDLTLFLDISPEKAKERGGYGEERYEKEEMQSRVRELFAHIAQESDGTEGWKWVTIDAGRTLQEVEDAIWHEVEPVLHDERSPLGQLWVSRSPTKS